MCEIENNKLCFFDKISNLSNYEARAYILIYAFRIEAKLRTFIFNCRKNFAHFFALERHADED